MKQETDHTGVFLLAKLFELHEQLPEKRLFTFQQEKEAPDFLTVKALVNKTKILGSILQQKLAPQEKVLLLFPQGLGYIYSLLACWYANVIAIPIQIAEVAEQEQVLAKISAILIDSQAACIITDTNLKEFLTTQQVVNQMPILNIDELPSDDLSNRKVRPQAPSDIALLLYTSGSISQPKGVMLSHSNLLSQAFMGATHWKVNQESCIVSWMPQFHNFGLFFNLLSPLLTGASSVILSPSSFIKNPKVWLKTIDQYQATHTAAPNFAFDYCCSSINAVTLKECSLHSLQVIVCGGEPVCKETYENFTKKFKTLGLRKNIFCAHYGLSETGSVTTSKPSQPLRFLSLDISLLGEGKIKHTNQKKKSKSVASCGEIDETIQILIVRPETCVPCVPGEIGEIWIQSPSVAMGYLNRPEETESTFSRVLSTTNEGEFFRSGDLGFIENNQLFVVGREKEVIIIHGKNHHPVDIEWTIKKHIPNLTLPMAVFSCEINQQEKVVVVQEVETATHDTVYKKRIGEILAAVSKTHEIEVYEIVFIEKGMIPKTGSGKVQRKLCRNLYINQELSVLYKYQHRGAGVQSKVKTSPPQLDGDILAILKQQVFLPVLSTDLAGLEEVATFSQLGLDSIQYIQISKRIETVFDIEFAPVILFKYSCFTELVEYLSSQIEKRQSQGIDPIKAQADICADTSKVRETSIAIIGVHYNFPGGTSNSDDFWESLMQQKDCITPIAESRPQIVADCQNYNGMLESFPPWGGFIKDVELFDAPFFGISPLEAESMDPQQRKVLELIWSVIENSGYNPYKLAGKDIGLFVGAHNSEYAELVASQPELIDTYGAYLDTGLHMSMIAHRISRWFNFRGPSEVVNTACSSSLVAIHHAVESIYRGESSMAIAGGINLILASRTYRASNKAGMLSKDGRCKTFDEAADGFVRAEGYGAVLLKPYRQAIEDKDTIYGVIKGVVINHDGHSNSLRAPNLNAQKELIKAAYQKSGLPVETISYIETHGTGTPLGDPIEIQALQEAFREINPDLPRAFCGLGTVKTNIGHCESAAGIAGLVKILLSMKYGTLPGILHFKKLNPYISLQNSPFFIVEQTKEWKRFKDSRGKDIPRRAGISSFGFGGANAHVVLEEHISDSTTEQIPLLMDNNKMAIIPISAKTQACLRTYAQELHAFLSKSTAQEQNLRYKLGDITLLDLAYTLQVGRAAMEERIAFLVDGISELMRKLEAFIQNKSDIDNCWQGHVKQGKNMVALLGNDEDSQELVHKWVAKSKLDKVVQYWVQGGTIEWDLLYDQVKPRRINLPTYPFAKIRYWIPKLNASQANSTARVGLVKTPAGHHGTMMLEPGWKEQAITLGSTVPDYEQHLVILCEPAAVLGERIESYINGVRCLVLTSEEDNIAERFQIYASRIFEEIHCMFNGSHKGKLLIQIIVVNQAEKYLFSGLSGMLKTAHLENPKCNGQLIEMEAEVNSDEIIERLEENSLSPMDHHIRYQDGKRYIADWRKQEFSQEVAGIPWKNQGVYLITGGTGGLGQIFAREIVNKVKDTTLILTGRSVLSAFKQGELKELETLGARIEYKQIDVTRKEAVNNLIQYIRKNYGHLHGIIHSAGVSKANFIRKKTQEELQEVLAPKVAGVVNLDQASRDLPLDFFVLFSSIAGSLGVVGQADYAAANAFMDAYAKYRNTMVASKERHGQTLSINWPLWQEGGMRIDAETAKTMQQNTGMIAMQTTTGIWAFYQALASGKAQVMVTEGDLLHMQAQLLEVLPEVHSSYTAQVPAAPVEPWLLREKILHRLKVLFGEVTKISVAGIDPEEPLERYGLDSILITQLNQKLDGIFGELSKTIFYEYQTLNALVEYFTAEYPQKCLQWIGLEDQVQPIQEKSTMSPATDKMPVLASLKTGKKLTPNNSVYEPIAIIGISGRYPKAKTLKEYWDILKTGQDCITEIPHERWSIEGFYHADPQEAVAQGKSYSKWGGFIEGFADFDPLFFSIAPRDAINIDPQERLFLEVCWEVIEDAGYTREQLGGEYNRRVGVFAGINKTGFELYGPDLWKQGKLAYPRTSFGSVANRVSYLLNLQGPSMPIDTMCSSSLTAIHEACEHIHRGECEMAIAGGVNLYLHSSNYIDLCHIHMLSVDGKCKSFGLGGDGFVPGEGVGVVLLKPLSQATADGDHIYAVIRGTSINHGGKTNGYTVPNPIAQGDLIRLALDKAGVDARAVSYIEAHGTGTALGDPIEIAGLSQAFKKDTQDTGFCAIGSVKSNIGHLEAAAGIAGITKIVLQMKHQQIVPSLYATELNPNINFAKTPFVVQQALVEWKRPVVEINGETKEYPRIAGISSFGAGGSNAHVVMEEYIPQNLERHCGAINPQNPAIIVLSAKNEERLQVQVQQLLTAIQEQQFIDSNLIDIAYTLQVGREALEERLAMLVGSVKELVEKLNKFIKGQDGVIDLYRGQVQNNKETFAALAMDEEMQETIKKWIQRKKYAKLLGLWVKGFFVDWNKLYVDTKPRRVSLPTYSFAKERYWLPEIYAQPICSPATTLGMSAAIHPLLQQNTSDFSEQRFTSTFTGQEFFLADHVVKGQRVLPGVAYLEMARAAVKQATGALEEDQTGIRLENVVWVRPVVVGEQPIKVHIGLFPEDNGEITFEIYSDSEEAGTEPIVHSQGRVVLGSVRKAQVLDLPALQAQCSQSTLSSSQCYEAFKVMGIGYGSAYRGIEMVYVGSDQVLAKLSLPLSVSNTQEQFVLHPSLMDSALQASLGLIMSSGDGIIRTAPLEPALPFALQEIEILGNCTSAMWTLIRYADGSKAGDKVQKLDIDLYDVQGNACVRMKGLSFRVLEGEVVSVRSSAIPGTLMLHPCWKEQAVIREIIVPDYVQHVVVLCEINNISPETIETQINGVRCLTPASKYKGIGERFQDYATQVFEEIQSILKVKPAEHVLVQIVTCNQGEQQLFAGILGLLKTAQLENPKLFGQLVEIEPDEATEGIIEKLQENSQKSMDNRVRYKDGKRYVAVLRELETSREAVGIPWKDQGIYLITGGAGRLGLIFAKEIAHQVGDATLVLTGRSPLDEKKKAELKELQDFGTRIEYRQVDVTKEKAVVNLIQSIQADFGGINGIIHSAGVIQDNFIIKKTREDLQEVLAPKVTGLVHLDRASRELKLDFFILFSSIAGRLGNPAQADYAAANAFMDAYAKYRNTLVSSKQCHGQTLSINWPLWQEGGMRVDAENEKMMRQSTGMIAMQTSTGIRTLYQSIAFAKDQVMVLEGNVVQLRHWLELNLASRKITNPKEKNSAVDDSLEVQTLNFVKEILANEIKLSQERIQIDIPFEKYGVDSIVQMNLIREIEKVTGELSKTLLFEYSNIQELVEYLVKNHGNKLMESIALENDKVLKQETAILPGFSEDKSQTLQKRHRFTNFTKAESSLTIQKTEDIAIIGISGRYPLSNTLEELWEHLKDGDNCITEAPADRWNISLTTVLTEDQLQHQNQRYYGGFLDHINHFDHNLFEFAQEQVIELSPELRLFLEIAWETFEDAGYSKTLLQELQTRNHSGVGVFVGTMYNQYSWTIPSLEQAVLSSNSTDWQIANRTSHFFNLTGPSIAVNSACSSSLTAIHLACESLKQRSCSMAIAGGVNLTLDPSKYKGLQQIKFLGSGNQSKSFGTGNGYIPGEGVGAVLLKPLSLAIKDGDRIHAVIKSSFINHSGGRQAYTAPEPKQQAQLITESMRRSEIDPLTIGYVESAANGSDLGDPIEIVALNNAFKRYTEKQQFCALGSVKSNLGHLEAASGISQLSKVILQMKHKTLVPTINANPQNPNIKLEHTAFYLQKETRPWNQTIDAHTGKKLPRRSMINSFGAGGAYANLIIEEFMGEVPMKGLSISLPPEQLIIFSAKTKWSMMRYIEKMQEFLQKNSSVDIADVARLLQKVNHNLEYRATIIVSSIREFVEKLNLLQESRDNLTDSNICISSGFEMDTNDTKSLIIQQALEKKDVRQLAQLWIAGATIDFGQLNENSGTPAIDLPKYAFEHHITFDFNNNYLINKEDETAKCDDEFYRILLEKIAKGELSEDEFADAINLAIIE